MGRGKSIHKIAKKKKKRLELLINLNIFIMNTSNLFTLNWRDFINGLIMAILAPVVVTLQQTIVTGSLTFNWTLIGVTALGGALGYVIKNFFTPTKKELF